jgi:hypothetical protein
MPQVQPWRSDRVKDSSRLLGVIATILLTGAAASGASKEDRRFSVRVDGKPAGSCRMLIDQHEDGSIIMTAEAKVQVNHLIYRYHYWYRGAEAWKDGRLNWLRSRSNDDGKSFSVEAVQSQTGLQVRVNDQQPTSLPSDVWTTTYWQLPVAKIQGGSIYLLDVDTGRLLQGTVQVIGNESITAMGKTTQCGCYRLNAQEVGGKNRIQGDFWYDAANRLVRQDVKEDGHQVSLDLVEVQR